MGGINAKVKHAENVYAVLCQHLSTCRVSQAKVWVPDSACDCGAAHSRMSRVVYGASNIVTNTGDIYYAQLAAGDTPTDTYTQITVSTSNASTPGKASDAGDVTAPPSGGTQNFASTYPNVNDTDTNNPTTTLVDMVTFRADYGTGDANATLTDVCINETGATFGSGTDPLLMHAEFSSSFTKDSSFSMSVYVNHTFNGV